MNLLMTQDLTGFQLKHIALLVTMAGSLFAQKTGTDKPPDSALRAQHYRFEVASIRPTGPPTGMEYPS
jgi:hypothetical protein